MNAIGMLFSLKVILLLFGTILASTSRKKSQELPETISVKDDKECEGYPGTPGPMGPVGPRGPKGAMGRPGLRGYRGICKRPECKVIKVKHGEDGQGNYLISACNKLPSDSSSGLYRIHLSSGDVYTVYCEMGINGGGYTFIPHEMFARLTEKDINRLFQNRSDVLLRLAQPDGSQPYTIISQIIDAGGIRINLNSPGNEEAPINKDTVSVPYLYLNTLPASIARNMSKTGFKSNNKKIIYSNCDNVIARNYFAFFPNPKEREVSTYLNMDFYERQGVAVDWRKSAKQPPSGRRMPLNFFLLTEMHYGGCGCYTSSDRWLRATAPAHGTAIGLR